MVQINFDQIDEEMKKVETIKKEEAAAKAVEEAEGKKQFKPDMKLWGIFAGIVVVLIGVSVYISFFM